MIGALLGFGGLGLKLFLFLGQKVFSGAMLARRSVTTNGANVFGFLAAAAKPKTAAVSLEMAQRQALMQGSWFSPVRLFVIVWLLTFAWGAYGNWMLAPGLKLQMERMKHDNCQEDDQREICQQLMATMALNARFQQANLDWKKANDDLQKTYEAKLRDLSKTIQAEAARAVTANARIKRANDEAARIIAGAELKPDDYRSFVRELVKTEAVDGSGSGSSSGAAGDVQPGMLHGAGSVSAPATEPGAGTNSNTQSEAANPR